MTVQILGIDAGGTMTDTILIDKKGEMVIGKAATTPHDESIGFMNSFNDALTYWNLDIDTSVEGLDAVIYSGTAMLNALIQRRGRKVGLIITKGLEDYLLMERGVQTYLGYHYPDRLHTVTHVHNPPLRIQQVAVDRLPLRFGRSLFAAHPRHAKGHGHSSLYGNVHWGIAQC